ncbi:hypothetical protein [Maridesulfovibrio hydrothermalis]|uniref:Uncharacterized protein n=1 Tax=Maridesulfovibrio hydrothermalis AM13 = DSM 14728 TaxID=1121451 RepID=L0R5T8_9BACT|nr:hypothetical protein [Maridesulfovibrio hydrothermalis]CCO22029.1 conserved exported protein of unknown function [Maridesulfovibrio hydrothermalis AM13 = DSM 14728]
MNKFKIPALIFAAVFALSAITLFIFIKKDVQENPDLQVDAPAWVHKEGSSGKQTISSKVVKSDSQIAQLAPANASTPTDDKQNKKQTENTPKTIDKAEQTPLADKINEIKNTIITDVFLNNLAEYIADNYHPAGSLPHHPEEGYSSASFKSINTYFGLNLRGLMPEAKSLISARKTIWDEVLSSGTLPLLYKSDSTALLDLVEEKGILAERKFAADGTAVELKELTRAQRAEMFRVSARPLRHVAAVLTAITQNRDLLQAMDGYIKAERRVDSANGLFQADLDQSRNSNSAYAKNKASHSGKVLKDAITVREKIKLGISEKIKSFCSGFCEKPDDSFYIAKWVFRRANGDEKKIEAILSGSKILNKLASDMEKRADLIEKAI